jgi:hypothetical protein
MLVEFLNDARCDHHIDGFCAREKVLPRDVFQVANLNKSICIGKEYLDFTAHLDDLGRSSRTCNAKLLMGFPFQPL